MGLKYEPLVDNGSLKGFKSFDVTPVLGTEFPDAKLKDWLEAPNSDELIRDLAITVSYRGVVFFRRQPELDAELAKKLMERLGRLTYRPADAGLYTHPRTTFYNNDPLIELLDSSAWRRMLKMKFKNLVNFQERQTGQSHWHTDHPCEPAPNDYSLLRIYQRPTSGGDTLFASQYEALDRISLPVRRFLESLTVIGAELNPTEPDDPAFQAPRGSPLNVGANIDVRHPFIRTNPVTGWKGAWGLGCQLPRIADVTTRESNMIMDFVWGIIVTNHDLQLRFQWGQDDVAIWDNRSVFHAATYDCDDTITRLGIHVAGVGEVPYLDPESLTRKEWFDRQAQPADGNENGYKKGDKE